MEQLLDSSWKETLQTEFEQDYFKKLKEFVLHEYTTETIYPPENQIFQAFNHCKLPDVKVVILGQDPYHGDKQAHGLSFSVNNSIPHPPSLRNIFKEIELDLGIHPPKSGNLERWAKQGVLLLNSTLTVRGNQAGSHQRKGWEKFTDKVIEILASSEEPIAFVLWGAYAQKKGKIIDASKHLVIKSVHPSPLSAHRGFFGNKQFSTVNSWLLTKEKLPIEW